MARTTPIHSGFKISNGAGTGSNGSRIDVWVEYQWGTPNASANTTPFEAYFYAALRSGQTSSTQLNYGLNSQFAVNGVSGSAVSNGAYNFTSSDIVNPLGSWSGNIPHNSDGTKSIQIIGSFTTQSQYISGGNVSVTVVLPVIPRASTIGASDANIGSASTIVVNKKSTAYTHSIYFQFGSLSGYVTADGSVSNQEVKFSETSISFNIPDTFYSQITNAKSGVCSLTCNTYSGNSKIGDSQPATFIATASQSLSSPTVSGTVVDLNSTTVALTGDANKLVRYRSTARCTITATAKNGASITSKTIAGTPAPENTLTIPNVEVGSFVFAVKDSREYENSVNVNAVLIPYIPLTSVATADRTNPTDNSGRVRVTGNYFKGNFGSADNSLSVKIRVSGGSWVSVTPTINNNRYAAESTFQNLDYQSRHIIEVEVSDRLTTISQQITLKQGLPVFDWGEKDFSFNVPVRFNAVSYDSANKKLIIS